MGNFKLSTSENSFRFEIFNTIDQENENNLTKDKCLQPPPIFIDCVSNIIPFYKLLNKVAKDVYELKIINSDQVKIQSKTSDNFKTMA